MLTQCWSNICCYQRNTSSVENISCLIFFRLRMYCCNLHHYVAAVNDGFGLAGSVCEVMKPWSLSRFEKDLPMCLKVCSGGRRVWDIPFSFLRVLCRISSALLTLLISSCAVQESRRAEQSLITLLSKPFCFHLFVPVEFLNVWLSAAPSCPDGMNKCQDGTFHTNTHSEIYLLAVNCMFRALLAFRPYCFYSNSSFTTRENIFIFI